jgi:predicted nuclease with TOPRIM domain
MLGGLEKAVDIIIKTLSENREADARYRTDIREKIERLGSENHSMRADVNFVKDKIEKIEPKVDSLEQKEHREEAVKTFAVSIGSFLGKAAQLAIGALGGVLAVFAEKMFHR